MPRERKKSSKLNVTEYNIAGNSFRTWRTKNGKLILVVDDTVDDYKTNVLLVMFAFGNRKWDDVLVNDYNVDLETVRPRRDNLYQKIDIEYDGLRNYERLIRAYENNGDVDAALARLFDFRDAAVRRAATERLTAAEEIIDRANDTIARTERTLRGLGFRLHETREKLAKQRAKVGKEPTKQSAAQILRSEYRIESTNEKVARAEKRIENARHRIAVAREDADAARALLARRRPGVKISKPVRDTVAKNVPQLSKPDDVPLLAVPEYELEPEPREEKMPDSEEVKPLFDKDPEILDDEIAFKPVEFDDIKPRIDNPVRPRSPIADDVPMQEPTPEPAPETAQRPQEITESVDYTETELMPHNEPMSDSIRIIDEPAVVESQVEDVSTNQYDNVATSAPRPATNSMPAPEVRPQYAPAASARPVSPITGGTVRPVGGGRSKPTAAYYLLLILLIALSIFTLWLYQKKNGGTVPSIGDTVVVSQPDVLTVSGTSDIAPEPAPAPEPVVAPEPAPEPEPVAEPLPAPVADAPIKIVYPNEDVLRAAEPDVPVVEDEENVLARKEAYGVSREDKPVYVPEPVVRVTNVAAPDVIFDDEVVSVPVQPVEPEYYDDGMGYYVEEDYDAYADDAGGFVNPDARFGADNQYGPETRRELSIHDGGQYSISYDETIY